MSGLTSAATSINEDEDGGGLCRLNHLLKLPVSRDWRFEFSGNGGDRFEEAQQKTALDRVINILRQRPARRQRRRRIQLAYEKGWGVTSDTTEAATWYRKAANQGDILAQCNLGAMHADGQGVPQDYVEAYKWFNLSAVQGYPNAQTGRDRIAQQMTPAQIAEAQRLSRQFRPHKEGTLDQSDSPIASGTGFFITDDGYLISNYHVVKDAMKVRLLTSAGLIDAKVVQVDAANDLALLKATGRSAPLPIAASRTVNLGGTVATIGFPDIGLQGFAPKLAKGEIASLSGAADDPRYFQISVPVQPGNSGGALVDDRGNVIGIVSANTQITFCICISLFSRPTPPFCSFAQQT